MPLLRDSMKTLEAAAKASPEAGAAALKKMIADHAKDHQPLANNLAYLFNLKEAKNGDDVIKLLSKVRSVNHPLVIAALMADESLIVQ